MKPASGSDRYLLNKIFATIRMILLGRRYEHKRACERWAGSVGCRRRAGAALIYLLDPKMGRRRRALARDKIKRAVHLAGEGTATTWRDACNRTRGMLHEAASLFERRPVSDQVLVGRIRSKLGFLVRHPGSIEMTAEQGPGDAVGLDPFT
jgi:hypothetical protein